MTQEIETLTARLEETQNNLSIAQRTTDKLEDAFRQMEREKNELIQVSDSLELYLQSVNVAIGTAGKLVSCRSREELADSQMCVDHLSIVN